MIHYNHPAGHARAAAERLLPLVARPIAGRSRARIRPHMLKAEQVPVTTLLYADDAHCSDRVRGGLAGLAKHSTIVRSGGEAIDLLWDPGWHVDAAFVSLQDADSEIVRFFRAVKDTHPWIRRIAFAEHERSCGNRSPSCEHDMLLWDPWDRENFAGILSSAVDGRPSAPRSSWPDLDLFDSRCGRDPRAIAEIAIRYRHRIVHLVLDATRDVRDAEDVVQEIFCQIVRLLPAFAGGSSPAHWIDEVCEDVIRGYRTGQRRRLETLEVLREVQLA